jgi:hypothetical protein
MLKAIIHSTLGHHIFKLESNDCRAFKHALDSFKKHVPAKHRKFLALIEKWLVRPTGAEHLRTWTLTLKCQVVWKELEASGPDGIIKGVLNEIRTTLRQMEETALRASGEPMNHVRRFCAGNCVAARRSGAP